MIKMDGLRIERVPAGGFVVTGEPDVLGMQPVTLFACSQIDEAFAFIREKFALPTATAVEHDFKIGDMVNLNTCSIGDEPGCIIGLVLGLEDDVEVKVRWSGGHVQTLPSERLRHEHINPSAGA